MYPHSDIEKICADVDCILFLSATMLERLFLLLFLTGHVFAKEPPDVNCLVEYLDHIKCSWNGRGTPEVNCTFYNWFSSGDFRTCNTVLSENSVMIGCIEPCPNAKTMRFHTFNTRLVCGNQTFQKTHDLKNRVLLYPPVNLTVQKEADSNLWLYWNNTFKQCAESEVRLRINDNKWETSKISTEIQSFCINLPSNKSRYEMQVRSKIGNTCGESIFWSNWSEPVVWGSNNSTDTTQSISMSVWTPVLYVVGVITLIILVMMLLHYERLRFILIPVLPKPSLIHRDMENWLQSTKGLNFESFKANYNERACPVREYCQVTQFDSESSDSSTCSVTTFQTDCSVSIPANEPEDLSTPCSSSSSTVIVSCKEQLMSN